MAQPCVPAFYQPKSRRLKWSKAHLVKYTDAVPILKRSIQEPGYALWTLAPATNARDWHKRK